MRSSNVYVPHAFFVCQSLCVGRVEFSFRSRNEVTRMTYIYNEKKSAIGGVNNQTETTNRLRRAQRRREEACARGTLRRYLRSANVIDKRSHNVCAFEHILEHCLSNESPQLETQTQTTAQTRTEIEPTRPPDAVSEARHHRHDAAKLCVVADRLLVVPAVAEEVQIDAVDVLRLPPIVAVPCRVLAVVDDRPAVLRHQSPLATTTNANSESVGRLPHHARSLNCKCSPFST
jgi:hypothetical protein